MRIARHLPIVIAAMLCWLPAVAQDEAKPEPVPVARRVLAYRLPSRMVGMLYKRAKLMNEAKDLEREIEYYDRLFDDTESRRYERKKEKAAEDLDDLKGDLADIQKDIHDEIERSTRDYARELDRITDRIMRMEEQAADAPEKTRDKIYQKADQLRVRQEYDQEVVTAVSGAGEFGTEFGERGKPAPITSSRARKWSAVGSFTVPLQDGSVYNSANRKGILVMLFWSGLNPDSLRALKEVNDLARKDRDGKDVEYLAVNVNDTAAEIEGALRGGADRLTVKMGYNGASADEKLPKVKDKTAADQFLVRLVPTLVVVNYEGIVEQVLIGYDSGFGNLAAEMVKAIVDRREEVQKREAKK